MNVSFFFSLKNKIEKEKLIIYFSRMDLIKVIIKKLARSLQKFIILSGNS